MNLIPVAANGTHLTLSPQIGWRHDGWLPVAEHLLLGIRPEKLTLHPAGQGCLPGRVAVIERLGAETVLGCRIAVTASGPRDQPLIFVRLPGSPSIALGDACSLDYCPQDAVWFDPDSGVRISPAPC